MLGEVRGGDKRYYNSDALGSTRAIADATGNVSATKETDAFGNVFAQTGTQTPFGFAGQHGYQTDADSGLQKLGYRYYDASTGRFLSRDPIQDGYNWYIYCDNDPVNAVDPEGLQEKPKEKDKEKKKDKVKVDLVLPVQDGILIISIDTTGGVNGGIGGPIGNVDISVTGGTQNGGGVNATLTYPAKKPKKKPKPKIKKIVHIDANGTETVLYEDP